MSNLNTDQQNDLALIRRALFSGQKSIAKSQAQAAFLRLVEQLPSAPCGLGEISQQDINEIQDLLESIPTNLEEDRRNSRVIDALKRSRDVGVLDTVAAHYPGAGWRMTDLGEDMTPTCTIYPTVRTADAKHFTAGDPDAARAAAAAALVAIAKQKRIP